MNLELLSKVNAVDQTINQVIKQIKSFINLKNLEVGDKLPSERILSEKFCVKRNIVREAIQKLEFYGLLISKPQSGTFISDMGITALNGMIDEILQLDKPSFVSLVETRIIIETKTIFLASKKRTNADLFSIEKALDDYSNKVLQGEDAVQEDLLFHLSISKASGNSSLHNFLLMISPAIISSYQKYEICDDEQDHASKIIKEHKELFAAIKDQNCDLGVNRMIHHFKDLREYCKLV